MNQDKKKSGGKQLWVLLNGENRVDIVRDVAEDAVDAALAAVVTVSDRSASPDHTPT